MEGPGQICGKMHLMEVISSHALKRSHGVLRASGTCTKRIHALLSECERRSCASLRLEEPRIQVRWFILVSLLSTFDS